MRPTKRSRTLTPGSSTLLTTSHDAARSISGTRVVVAAPAQGIKPSGQAKPGRSVVGEFREAVTVTDQHEVPFALAPEVKISLERRTSLQTKLADQESRYRAWDFGIGAREGAEEPSRSQHEREAEAIVVTPQPVDDLQIASVEVEIPRQLIGRRRCGKTGMALPLLIGQVAGGHTVRNLGVLRRGRGTPESNDFSLAKYLRGSRYFSNKFCETPGAPA